MKQEITDEKSFVYSVYKVRHHSKDIFIALPIIIAIFFPCLVAPFIIAFCEPPVIVDFLLIVGPILLACLYYAIRKTVVMKWFYKVKDINGRVDITEIPYHTFEASDPGKVYMFSASENMDKILYNWLLGLNVLPNDRLKIYKVFIDNYAPIYYGIRETDLNITEESRINYEKETKNLLLLSDMENGKVVNVKLYSRISQIH